MSVLIAGAGPAGLAAASELAHHGIRSVRGRAAPRGPSEAPREDHECEDDGAVSALGRRGCGTPRGTAFTRLVSTCRVLRHLRQRGDHRIPGRLRPQHRRARTRCRVGAGDWYSRLSSTSCASTWRAPVSPSSASAGACAASRSSRTA
ncbi:FAD-dependent monooxygenase [Streptomyces antimycoticus]